MNTHTHIPRRPTRSGCATTTTVVSPRANLRGQGGKCLFLKTFLGERLLGRQKVTKRRKPCPSLPVILDSLLGYPITVGAFILRKKTLTMFSLGPLPVRARNVFWGKDLSMILRAECSDVIHEEGASLQVFGMTLS